MLDINLEDHQQALLHVLSRQIQRGEISNAIETAKSYILMSKSYLFKVEEIIGDAAAASMLSRAMREPWGL